MPLQLIRGAAPARGPALSPAAGDQEITQAYLGLFRRGCGIFPGGSVTVGLLGLEDGVSPERSLRLGVRAASIYLRARDASITIAVPEGRELSLTEGFYQSLKAYIAQRYEGFDGQLFDQSFSRSAPQAPIIAPLCGAVAANMPPVKAAKSPALEDMLKKTDAGFSETLLKLIDRAGKKDAEVYKRANIDRKLFSKIRSNPAYRPSKSTALALSFALELDISETRDLIGRAGYTLTHASQGDIIVEYFIVNKNYDIFALNETLFAFDQPLLGGA